MNMQLIEDIIAGLAPKWAAERAYYRSLYRASRAYEAARLDRNTAGWIATGTSANAEIGQGLARIRNRSRDLVRNNPYAASACRKIAAHIVGVEIGARPASGSEREKAQVRENWDIFVRGCDPEGLSSFNAYARLVARTVPESGEALIRWHDRPLSREFPSSVQCEILEPDYIDQMRNEELSNGHLVVQGVEYDRDGRRVAYWLFDQHPGDTPIIRTRSYLSQRVEARYVSPVFDRLRPGQVRGVPWFAHVALQLKHVDDYAYAERIRKAIAACFVGFVKQEGIATLGQAAKEEGKPSSEARTLEKMAPGLMHYLRPGEDVTFGSPNQDAGYAEYLIAELHAIAAGIGTPYYMMTGDLRQANYGSQRVGMLDFWLLLDGWQQHMVIPQMYAQAWTRVHTSAARLGLGPETIPSAIWQPPRRAWIDPKNEADAEDQDLQHGTVTWPEAVHRRGRDPEEVLEELERYAPRLKQLGIDLFSATPTGEPDANSKENDDAGSEPPSRARAAKRGNGHDRAAGFGPAGHA